MTTTSHLDLLIPFGRLDVPFGRLDAAFFHAGLFHAGEVEVTISIVSNMTLDSTAVSSTGSRTRAVRSVKRGHKPVVVRAGDDRVVITARAGADTKTATMDVRDDLAAICVIWDAAPYRCKNKTAPYSCKTRKILTTISIDRTKTGDITKGMTMRAAKATEITKDYNNVGMIRYFNTSAMIAYVNLTMRFSNGTRTKASLFEALEAYFDVCNIMLASAKKCLDIVWGYGTEVCYDLDKYYLLHCQWAQFLLLFNQITNLVYLFGLDAGLEYQIHKRFHDMPRPSLEDLGTFVMWLRTDVPELRHLLFRIRKSESWQRVKADSEQNEEQNEAGQIVKSDYFGMRY